MSSKVVTENQVYRMLNGRGFDLTEPNTCTGGIIADANSTKDLTNALQESSDRRVVINVVGDSISFGIAASSMNLATGSGTSYVALLQKELQARYGDGGSGFQTAQQDSNWDARYDLVAADARPVYLTGTTTPWTEKRGISSTIGAYYLQANNLTATATFKTRGTSVVIFYAGQPTNAHWFNVTIDGVNLGTFNTQSTTQYRCGEKEYTGLSNGVHTVVIQASAGTPRLCGVGGYNYTGVVINNVSVGTLSYQDYYNTMTASADAYGFPWYYTFGLASSNMGGPSTFVPHLYPDACLLALGVNDAHGFLAETDDNVILQKLETALWTACRDYKEWNQKCSILCMSPLLNGGSDIEDMRYYKIHDTLRKLMKEFNGVYIELNNYGKHNSFPQAKSDGYYFNTTIGIPGSNSTLTSSIDFAHPGNNGHQFIKDSILPFFLTEF